MLSIVFLMMYVVSSVRTGTVGIQQDLDYDQVMAENEDLKQQIKVYNTLKEDYLEKGASQEEQALYQELISKLDLLEDESKLVKDKLKLQALELEKKELALNKYQQAVRNIINSNMLA
jgi:type III secretory pathway component EscR